MEKSKLIGLNDLPSGLLKGVIILMQTLLLQHRKICVLKTIRTRAGIYFVIRFVPRAFPRVKETIKCFELAYMRQYYMTAMLV